MDELFDKIKDGASKTKDAAGHFAKAFAKHTSNAITSTKLSYSINEANNKINDVYAQIGKALYERHLAGEDIYDFTDEFEKIDVLMHDIEALRDKKAELKNALRCTECDTLNPAGSEYCSKCGAPLSTDSDDDSDDDDEAEDVITITPEKGE